MKHLLILNCKAGKNDDLLPLINKAFKGLDYEIYHTKGPKDATAFLKKYFSTEKELTRVYACGGDGTLNEVVNGIYGFENAELALYACGTGNDFSKIYGGKDKFLDFKTLINGKASPIDITKISGETLDKDFYSVNVVNIGFDAMVGAMGNINKEKGKKDPYGAAAIIPAILHGRFNKVVVSCDDEPLNKKKLLLSSIAQGNYIGGEYHASPKSKNDDGLLDVIVLKTMSLVTLLTKFFDRYHDGQLLDNPKCASKVLYKRCKKATIEAVKDIDVCIDGEMVKGKKFNLECIPAAIKFVKPE